MYVYQIIRLVVQFVGETIKFAKYKNQISQSPAKIRVVPKLAFPGASDEMISELYFTPKVQQAIRELRVNACIEISNLGLKTEYIPDLGFVAIDKKYIPWRDPDSIEPKQSLPIGIEPGESVSVYLRIFPEDEMPISKKAYVKTDCGETFYGESPILTDMLLQQEQSDRTVA